MKSMRWQSFWQTCFKSETGAFKPPEQKYLIEFPDLSPSTYVSGIFRKEKFTVESFSRTTDLGTGDSNSNDYNFDRGGVSLTPLGRYFGNQVLDSAGILYDLPSCTYRSSLSIKSWVACLSLFERLGLGHFFILLVWRTSDRGCSNVHIINIDMETDCQVHRFHCQLVVQSFK